MTSIGSSVSSSPDLGLPRTWTIGKAVLMVLGVILLAVGLDSFIGFPQGLSAALSGLDSIPTGVDLLGMITMGSLFVGYLLAVRLLEIITAKLRSITFIKSVHTIVFVPLSALLLVFAYEVVADRITYFTWIAIAVFLAEVVVLMTNNWRCPLTKYAERLGSTHGQITDFFFPKWFADRVFLFYGGLFAVSLVFLVIRLLR